MTGSIPSELGKLSQLIIVSLQSNSLEGIIYTELKLMYYNYKLQTKMNV